MNFDLRKPLGAMFTLLGAMLVVYGLWSSPEIYRRSFGVNVNLIWGAVMLVFGGTMLWFGRRSLPEPAAISKPPAGPVSDPPAHDRRGVHGVS